MYIHTLTLHDYVSRGQQKMGRDGKSSVKCFLFFFTYICGSSDISCVNSAYTLGLSGLPGNNRFIKTHWLRQNLCSSCLLSQTNNNKKHCVSYLLHNLGIKIKPWIEWFWPPFFGCAFLLHLMNPQQKSDSNSFVPYSYSLPTKNKKKFGCSLALISSIFADGVGIS